MMRTVVLSSLVLLLAAGGPAVFHWGKEYYKEYDKQYGSGRTSTTTTKSSKSGKSSAATAADDKDTQETVILDLAEALNMNITPGWVLQHWPRVSTGGAQLQLQGYRVPLVTGIAEDDLAGSMTYLFNPQQQLQRMVFYGTTGTPQKLLIFLTSRYGFARRIINDPATFVYEVPSGGAQPKSYLEMRAFDVLKQSQPLRRFQVTLVIERPEEM